MKRKEIIKKSMEIIREQFRIAESFYNDGNTKLALRCCHEVMSYTDFMHRVKLITFEQWKYLNNIRSKVENTILGITI